MAKAAQGRLLGHIPPWILETPPGPGGQGLTHRGGSRRLRQQPSGLDGRGLAAYHLLPYMGICLGSGYRLFLTSRHAWSIRSITPDSSASEMAF